jgi:DNA-binding XRE family transcriptional regulator
VTRIDISAPFILPKTQASRCEARAEFHRGPDSSNPQSHTFGCGPFCTSPSHSAALHSRSPGRSYRAWESAARPSDRPASVSPSLPQCFSGTLTMLFSSGSCHLEGLMRLVSNLPTFTADVSVEAADPAFRRIGTTERAANIVVTLCTEMILSRLVPTMAAIGCVSAALEAWREGQKVQIAQVLRNSVVGKPFGKRIRNLRMVLGWSQRKTAEHFGVSVRTVIRHERGESFRLRLPMLQRLRALEADNAEELIAYLVYVERTDPSLLDPFLGSK